MQQPHTAHLALGSNLGDRRARIAEALQRLAEAGVVVRRCSEIIETPAEGGPAGSPPFLNAAAEVSTTLAPHPLLHVLMDVERAMGRVRRVKWEPRPIDLDLLLYGQRIISSQELIIPHPLMHERLFVLKPLAEIAPDAVHPVLQMRISALLADRVGRITPV